MLTIFGFIIFFSTWNLTIDEDEDGDVYYPISANNKLSIFIVLIFLVSWNELYIHRNDTDRADNDWGFAQVIFSSL